MLRRDSDLFASHYHGWKMQNWLTAKVKFELRSIQPVTDILSNFLASKRLLSRVAIDLAVRSNSSRYLFCGK